MTTMTPEDVRALLVSEMRNLNLPAPVERSLYSDLRDICDRLWSEYMELEGTTDTEGCGRADILFCEVRKNVDATIRFRIDKIAKLAFDATYANMVHEGLDSLPPEEIDAYMAFRNGIRSIFRTFAGKWSMSPIVKNIADELDGIEYPVHIPSGVRKTAKDCGFQVVFGESDDLIEFDGAFSDELGAWIGDRGGTREYVSSEGRRITAVWCENKKVSWTYRTDIPHETFRVFDRDMEDDEIYCIGIVFEAMPGETWSEEER